VATEPQGIQVTEGPTIPATRYLHELRTGGDYAASEGCYDTGPETGECSVFIARFSTKQLWKIRPRTGKAYHDVMAVSDSYVLVGETNYPFISRQQPPAVVRFRTAD
jgi:hypothetical protein